VSKTDSYATHHEGGTYTTNTDPEECEILRTADTAGTAIQVNQWDVRRQNGHWAWQRWRGRMWRLTVLLLPVLYLTFAPFAMVELGFDAGWRPLTEESLSGVWIRGLPATFAAVFVSFFCYVVVVPLLGDLALWVWKG